MKNNVIPPMTDPLGRFWDQPDTKDILVDDTHALMSSKTFHKLADYTQSQPTGAYVGKMWRDTGYHIVEGKVLSHWPRLVWFGEHPEPGWLSNNYRIILILD